MSNLELRRSYKALRDDLVGPSSRNISSICRRDCALTVDSIKKQLPSQNNVSLASDGRTSMRKLAITLVKGYNMDQNWALHEVQLAFNEVDDQFFSAFES